MTLSPGQKVEPMLLSAGNCCPTISQQDLPRSVNRASRSQALRVDRQRNRDVAADENRPQHVRLKTPQPVVAEHALSFEISDHRRRPCPLKRRVAVGAVEAHHPDRPGMPYVVPEDPKIVYQVTRGGSAALPAPSIEGADLLLSLEPVVADNVECVRQIKLMRLATAIAIHVGPVIGHQPIERVP